jgi:hypothetical protein
MSAEACRSETGLAVFVFVGRMIINPLVVLVLGISVVVEANSLSPNDMLAQEDDISQDNLPALDKLDTIGTEDAPNTPALLEMYTY